MSNTDVLIYESGRRRGLAECPCRRNPGAADLVDGEDAGAWCWRALVWALLLGLVAIGLRGRGRK